MILLSPEQIEYQIDYVLQHNDLPSASLLKPLAASVAEAQTRHLIHWLEGRSEEIAHVPECGCACRCIYMNDWQELKEEIGEWQELECG